MDDQSQSDLASRKKVCMSQRACKVETVYNGIACLHKCTITAVSKPAAHERSRRWMFAAHPKKADTSS